MNTILEAMQIIHNEQVFNYSNNPNWSNILSHPNEDIEYWITFFYDLWGIKKSKILIKITTLVDYINHFPNEPILEDTIFVWYFIARELKLKFSSNKLEEKIKNIRCSDFINKINEIFEEKKTISIYNQDTDSDSDSDSDFNDYTLNIKSEINKLKKSKQDNNTIFDSINFNKKIDELKKERTILINNYLNF